MRNGFQYLWISASTLSKGRATTAKTEPAQGSLEAVTERLAPRATANSDPGPATIAAVESVRYGEPVLVRPRLGQGTFRVIVTDVYERRCTIMGERTLPVLEAAHIKPYGVGGPHSSENGLLLRSDLHTLFDQDT